jgi:hypothetical protein
MFFPLILFLLVAACTEATSPIDDPQSFSLTSLPPEMLNTIYGYLALQDSLRLHTLLKNEDQEPNPLSIPRLKSRLNPITNHAVTDGKDAIELIKKSPNHLQRKLLAAYLHNPSLAKADRTEMMDLAIKSGMIDVVEAFAYYYKEPLSWYLFKLSYFMGQQKKLDILENFLQDPRVLRIMPNARHAVVHGAFDSGNTKTFKWLMNWLKFDSSLNYNWYFTIAVETGSIELAQVFYDHPRIQQTLDPNIVNVYIEQLQRRRIPALWPSSFLSEIYPEFSRHEKIAFMICLLLYLMLV